MNAPAWLQIAALLTLSAGSLPGQVPTVPGAGVELGAIQDVSGAARAATPGGRAILFDTIAVAGEPQRLTAAFKVTNGNGETPAVATHFGRDYAAGEVHCSGIGAVQACTVAVTFAPTLPGNRADALFFSQGGKRLATILLAGTGKSSFALLQPHASAAFAPSTGMAHQSVVDGAGTIYTLDLAANRITELRKGGASRVLPIAGLAASRQFTIDAGGLIYVLQAVDEPALLTFDTLTGRQGRLALPVAARNVNAIALDPAGAVYALCFSTHSLFAIAPDASVQTTAAPLRMDASAMLLRGIGGALPDRVVLGGSALALMSPSGEPVPVAANLPGGEVVPLALDAAGSLYVAAGTGVVQLSGIDYTGASWSMPVADAVGSNGSIYAGGVELDRTQGVLRFEASGKASTAESVTLYNGGNDALAIGDVHVTGAGYSLVPAIKGGCLGGLSVPPGESCVIAATRSASALSTSTGTVVLSSNSLNNPASQQIVPLLPLASLSQAVLAPAATVFPSTVVGVASTPLTVTLSNPGTAPLNIASIALVGAGSGSYSQTNNCAAPGVLAVGGTCTITVTFTPLSAATQAASISVLDDAGGVAASTQTASLTGVGTPAPAPVITFLPALGTGLSFGSANNIAQIVIVGNSSPPQTETFTNTGNAVLNISSIALTTSATVLPFTSTTTCGATLAVGASCTFTVIFTPVVGGAAPGPTYITLTDNAAGTPQRVPVSGTAVPTDYNVTVAAPLITIPSSGGSGQLVVTATPNPGPFPTTVNFTVFGLPPNATYSFSPSTIAPATALASTTLTVVLPAYHSVALAGFMPAHSGRGASLALLLLLISGLGLRSQRKRLPRFAQLSASLVVLSLGLGAATLSGCSAGYPLGGGVAPGTYVITITGTSANGAPASTFVPYQNTHSVVVNLVVQ